jgi:hypothetical protein
MSAEQILADLKTWKGLGTSPKMPVHIVALEKLCRDALAWQATPEYIRDVAEAVRGQK